MFRYVQSASVFGLHWTDTTCFVCLTESRSKRDKDGLRDDRDYDSEQVSSRDSRDDRDARERRDGRDRGRDTARDSRDQRESRDVRDSRESRTENRSSDSQREREREKEREKDRDREKDRVDTHRKEEPAQDDKSYGRGREDGGRTGGRAETRGDRAERNGRGHGRTNETSDKGTTRRRSALSTVQTSHSRLCTGSTRSSRGSQLDGSHDNWDARGGAARERSAERSADRGSDRDRYDGERRGEQARDSSYDRRGGHGDRDRRDNRDRGEWVVGLEVRKERPSKMIVWKEAGFSHVSRA